jgi:hypothetical protein
MEASQEASGSQEKFTHFRFPSQFVYLIFVASLRQQVSLGGIFGCAPTFRLCVVSVKPGEARPVIKAAVRDRRILERYHNFWHFLSFLTPTDLTCQTLCVNTYF